MGDCWFLASMASLALRKDMFAKVVPLDQSFEKGDYTGAFRFRFWRYGKWEEVVVDDYLPTKNGRLFLIQSDDSNEFWSALFEKAYAKIHGSYGAIHGGWVRDSFTDISGGILETFDLKSKPDNLFEIMFKADQKGALMSCSTDRQDRYGLEAMDSKRWTRRDGLEEMESKRWARSNGLELMDSKRWTHSDGLEVMDSKQWTRSDGLEAMESKQWTRSNGLETMDSKRWTRCDGLNAMDSKRWTRSDGLKAMDSRQWTQNNGLETMDSKRWTRSDGLKAMDSKCWTSSGGLEAMDSN